MTQSVQIGKIELFFDTFGEAGAPPVLLLMGNSAPGLVWPDAFCAMLADKGYHIVRFDQRDTGLSTYVDYDADPYTLDALVEDALGLLDALGIARAHLVGLSQGGVLACRMALAAPERAASLVSMMSSARLRPKTAAFTGAEQTPGDLPAPAPDYVAAVIALNSTPAEGVEAQAARFVDNFRLAKGPASPFDEAEWAALGRAFAERPLARRDALTAAIANNSNHSRAQAATPDLEAADLARIAVPTLVLHGGGDPIFPPDHARWTAAAISGARLRIIETMGHALDSAFFAPIADDLAQFWGEAAS